MKILKQILLIALPVSFIALSLVNSSCKNVHYGFHDRASIPDSIKTIKVEYIENRAPFVDPQLSPQLSDKLRQKIVSQTRLKQTSGDNADWVITGTITDYSFTTAGISNNQTSTNRITVAVHIIRTNQLDGTSSEYDVSRNFDFPSTQTVQQAQADLLSKIVKDLSDDIFNRLFSNW